MAYFTGSLAMSVGSSARKSAIAPRRAPWRLAAFGAGRIGTIDDRLSSSRKISAIARRKASPFLRELVAKYALIATRTKTISADGGGISSADDGRSISSGSGTERFPQTYSPLEKRAKHENKGGINCNKLINLKFSPRRSDAYWRAGCRFLPAGVI